MRGRARSRWILTGLLATLVVTLTGGLLLFADETKRAEKTEEASSTEAASAQPELEPSFNHCKINKIGGNPM